MSRTKEIEVWVDAEALRHYKAGEDIYYQFNSGNHDENTCRAKLIIDLPERKVTISESEFDEAFYGGHDCYDSRWSNEIRRAKDKLFGEEGA